MNTPSAGEARNDIVIERKAAFIAFERRLADIMLDRSPARIREELSLGCWIHGAGAYGRSIAALLQEAAFPVLGFIDRRGGPEFDCALGLPVLHPKALSPEQARSRTFVGAVMNPAADSSEMLGWAGALPFAARVIGPDLPDALGERAGTCWRSSRRLIHDNLEALRTVFLRLADAESLRVYSALLDYRITGLIEHHPPFDIANQYLPPDLPGFDRPITFVDGGAYTGDTCAHLLAQGIEIRRYVAFEPDRNNFTRLSDFVRNAPISESVALPCGLSDGFRTLSFLDGQGLASKVVDGGEDAVTIVCVGLDQSLPGLRPDFIKMDIEGGELAALEGMAQTIEAARPRLAVSLYHRPEDLWTLPAWISRYYDRLHIRQHAGYGFETVLYAIP
ncbi:MAG: FkbM family methyltransferase [Caulobacteraceae bacterium]